MVQLKRAIALDPNFAMAHAELGTAYQGMGEMGAASEATAKAYELRDRVSERERFYIESHYEQTVTGDMQKSRQIYETWQQLYPRDEVPPTNLGVIYSYIGDYSKLLSDSRASFDLSKDALGYTNLIGAYIGLDKFEEADTLVQQAKADKIDSIDLRAILYLIAFLKKDVPE